MVTSHRSMRRELVIDGLIIGAAIGTSMSLLLVATIVFFCL